MKKYILPTLFYTIAFLLIPFMLLNQIPHMNGFAFVIISLLLINSTVIFANGLIFTLTYGLDFIHPIIMAATFLISVYTIFNDSALIYLLWYLIVNVIAIFIGYYLRKKK